MKSPVWIRLGLLALLLVGVGWILRWFGVDVTRLSPERVRTFLLSFGLWAPLIYLVAYGQPIVPLPASIMTLAAGLAFGVWWGTLTALTGATIRASTEFLVARLLGRDVVAKLLKGKVAALDEKVGANSFKAVLLVRLIPNVPFDVQNYGFGFSRVRFGPYVAATFLGMIPGCFAFVYLGESLSDPKQFWKLGVAIALIVLLVVVTSLIKRRQASSAG